LSQRLSAPHASSAAIIRRRARFRLRLVHGRICITFNADDGQNNYCRRLVSLGATEAHDAPLVREFDDVAHQPLSSDGTHDPLKT
jgi:hypothetical protein